MRQLQIPKNPSLTERSDLTLSMKFGFIGLGMGGCAIAAECASIRTGVTNNYYPYSGLLVNTNTQDFEKLDYQNNQIVPLPLKGYEKGAGRDINIGEKAFVEHKQTFIEHVERHLQNRDFLWVVCGLGGGTGTGSVLQAIDALYQNGYEGRFGLILVLPRNGEGSKVFQNALSRLQEIAGAMGALGSIIIVDNNKLYNECMEQNPNISMKEYASYANRYIAQTLHELNTVTSSFSPYGENHFDSSEFENMIKTPGVVHISRAMLEPSQVDLGNELSYLNDIRDSLNDGVLSSGYNIGNGKRAALSVLANNKTAQRMYQLSFHSQLENMMEELVPRAQEKPVSYYIDNKAQQMHFYGMVAGLGLPSRVEELLEENDRLERLQKEATEEEDSVFAKLSSFKAPKEEEKEEKKSLFGDSPSTNDSSETPKQKKSLFDLNI
ncbi:plasmid replication protein (plasmid) [Pontibacillus sp. ALD_SL1]|uniref:plasmid replication protein n=1 Tax=Pontibacillus sp. ALD_SL1 TaxID=2777185 RepID=UPI001A976955|nr:plasmid replication protein [Pontibacillus sp. ALD_SL1]QST02876.1 plasmid replication protein [Pontibacillus sp. ALD_SL1]